MGDVSDIEDLLGKVKKEKLMKILWTVGTIAFTVVSTTGTVSWKMRGYVDELERANDKLRDEIRVIAKAAETSEKEAGKAVAAAAAAQYDAREARAVADKALIYAQLTKRDRP